MSANDRQVGGSHYSSKFQHWDYTIDILSNRYLEGQASLYLTRWRRVATPGRGGIEELEKSGHFIEKTIEAYEAKLVLPIILLGRFSYAKFKNFCDANALNPAEARIIEILSTWGNRSHLDHALVELRLMIDNEKRKAELIKGSASKVPPTGEE